MMTSYIRMLLFSLAILLSSSLLWHSWAFSQSGSTGRTTMADTITTNTTTIASKIPSGYKSIYGQVVGTGSVTQTQAIYGDIDGDNANGVLLCTLTLSGTTRAQDACPPFPANFYWFYIITTNTTGTGATGAVYAMY